MEKFFSNGVETYLEAKISFDNGDKKMFCLTTAKISDNGNIYVADEFLISRYIKEFQNSFGNKERMKRNLFIKIEDNNIKHLPELMALSFQKYSQQATNKLPEFKGYTNPKIDEIHYSLQIWMESNKNKMEQFYFETKVFPTDKGFLFDEYTSVYGMTVENNEVWWESEPFTQISNSKLSKVFTPNEEVEETFEKKVRHSFKKISKLKNQQNFENWSEAVDRIADDYRGVNEQDNWIANLARETIEESDDKFYKNIIKNQHSFNFGDGEYGENEYKNTKAAYDYDLRLLDSKQYDDDDFYEFNKEPFSVSYSKKGMPFKTEEEWYKTFTQQVALAVTQGLDLKFSEAQKAKWGFEPISETNKLNEKQELKNPQQDKKSSGMKM